MLSWDIVSSPRAVTVPACPQAGTVPGLGVGMLREGVLAGHWEGKCWVHSTAVGAAQGDLGKHTEKGVEKELTMKKSIEYINLCSI